ncbi:MAG: hypothetical protein AB1589_40350 [Cyanobacteriota bacterium]
MTFVNVTLLLILPEAIACEHLDLEGAIAPVVCRNGSASCILTRLEKIAL